MRNLQIMIVEDEYRIRMGLERFISNQPQCAVIGTFANGQEALDEWRLGKKAEVVLTDIKMPIMDGLTLITELKEAGYTGEFLVLSGFDDFQYVQQALRNQVTDYLLKPIDRQQLQDRLQQLCEKKQEIENVRERESQKQEQLQLLRALSSENSLADTQWREIFPSGTYYTCRLQLQNFHQQKAKRDPVRFHQELSAVVRIFNAELSNQWSDSSFWWWWDQEQSFGLLVHTEEENPSIFIDHIAGTLSHRTFFKLTASLGQILHELELLPAAMEAEQMEIKLQPASAESQYTEVINADTQDILHTLRFSFKQFVFDNVDAALYKLKDELAAEQLDSVIALVQSTGIEMLYDVSKRLPVNDVNRMLQKLGRYTSQTIPAFELLQGFENWTKDLADMCIRLDQHSDRTAVERAKAFIHHHVQEAITIEQVAAHVYMNPTYFCAYFKKHTRETVLQYVTKQRLELAKRKLEDTDDKVTIISDSVGYHDHKYFSKLFKKHTGFAPSEYRRLRR
ncbi:response regulator [Terribacillus sp. AE2B 122]|uniref:response regulator transcription factor n=1 Tax=Terribacillus sp. AE2B 122 TaxID=1331902 RepID=UPI001440646E|nr:response regulator [Terribacillus sp. AE2B 122]VVM32176.1 two-component response regulator [Terribacillus sp. AE2B 122]